MPSVGVEGAAVMCLPVSVALAGFSAAEAGALKAALRRLYVNMDRFPG